MRKVFFLVFSAAFISALWSETAQGAACPAYTYTWTNGDTADGEHVMTDLNGVLNCINGGFAGNVGIGTSTPTQAKLVIANGGVDAGLYIANATADIYLRGTSSGAVLGTPNNSSVIFNTNDAERLRIGPTGNVGIGSTSPTQAKLVISNGGADTGLYIVNATADIYLKGTSTGVTLGTPNGSNVILTTNDAERVRVSSTGSIRFSAYGAGTLQTDSSGNITATSDLRLKKVDGEFASGLEAILGLKPVLYHWNAVSGFDQTTQYAGFIAQDVLRTIPQAVGHSPSGYLTLSDRPIEAALVNSVKQLKALSDSQTAEIARLKNANAGLAASMRALADRTAALERRSRTRTARN